MDAAADARWHGLIAQVDQMRRSLDLEIARWSDGYRGRGGHLYCKAGCSGCCNLFVRTTLTEAIDIARDLDTDVRARLKEYVARQRRAMAGVAELREVLRLHRKVIGPCPFLDHAGGCSIYPQRPLACRALLSTRPSDWCAVDFSELDPFDRQAYLAALDRAVVAFPVHYVAASQNSANRMEERLLQGMSQTFGLAISGNLPLLIDMELTFDLGKAIAAGGDLRDTFASFGALHPLLLQVDRCEAKVTPPHIDGGSTP